MAVSALKSKGILGTVTLAHSAEALLYIDGHIMFAMLEVIRMVSRAIRVGSDHTDRVTSH